MAMAAPGQSPKLASAKAKNSIIPANSIANGKGGQSGIVQLGKGIATPRQLAAIRQNVQKSQQTW